MSKGRIRSRYQRRVLNWLLDGEGTVSSIADALNLQMPHASLALRQLRERGDVTREDQSGIRGAPHFITELGRQRLEQDALSRLRGNHLQPPMNADGIVLGHDGQYVLLGYVKPLASELIRLPEYALEDSTLPPIDSSGNRGGCWAVVRTESMRWYDLESLAPTHTPLPSEQGTLTDWSMRIPSICVVHARLIDPTKRWTMAPGSWFAAPDLVKSGHSTLEFGNHAIGHTEGDSVIIHPPMALHGHLASPVGRRLAMDAMSDEALVFEDHRQLNQPRTLPLESLWYWLKRRHPRLSTSKLELKFTELCNHFVGNDAPAPSIAVQRAILVDFGKANWTLGEVLSRINFAGTTSEGATALLEWYLADTMIECIVEWPHSVDGNRALLENLLGSLRCRLLLTSNGEPVVLANSSAVIKPVGKLGHVRLSLGRGLAFTIRLSEEIMKPRPAAVFERTPATAQEMINGYDGTHHSPEGFSLLEASLEQRTSIWHALSLYPEGDEEWANRNEGTAPLASWIATPEQDRSSRWIRIRNAVPSGWADLLPIDSCETATLLQAMPDGSPNWTRSALEKVRQRFTHNVESIPRYLHYLEDQECREWMASALLLSSQYLPEEFHPKIEYACTVWLEKPHHTISVLEGMFPLGTPLNEANQACLTLCLDAGTSQAKGSILNIWARAYSMLEINEPIQAEFLRLLMSALPCSWWTVWAADWLKIQLSSSSGRRWLATQPFSWPALVARPPGERGGMPGMPTAHLERRLALEDVLQIHLVRDGESKRALLDVHDMLATSERNEPVHHGRLHPLVGWLARPVDSWPRIGLEALNSGDEQIGALLYARSFAYRLE